MGCHAAQSNNTDCDSPKECVADEIKSDKEFSSNEEASSEILRICSCVGGKVGILKKKLLVLDINGLLVDLVYPPPNDQNPDTIIRGVAVFKRPFYLDFLKFCFERFEVSIWSSRSRRNVEPIVEYLMGEMKNKLLFCWDYSHCTGTSFKTFEDSHKELQFKDMKKVWDKQFPNLPWDKGYYNESNTLLLDDSPYKALLNPPYTTLFPHTFTYKNKSDNSLGAGGDLREYIGDLVNVENVPKYVEEHPFGQEPITKTSQSWNFYIQIIDSLSAS
ncbi:hypothetical protein HN51_032916 [Arachis hypogaea]|uniref:uncharacterized FCP1 homology domain-containing protein C1271.03c n=1 Tax=Arachis hypogaea TaxID=3818 RepID=UPI000DEC0814|nr:probable C-terminal domain small phosphatase [Arachis hypogaea]XP_025624235.1 probable C-terminal domain small phosphatase [Arachis hypogaea]QHO17311.1 uncharacterized protein DS421_10g311090 [Arachis hypogaea]